MTTTKKPAKKAAANKAPQKPLTRQMLTSILREHDQTMAREYGAKLSALWAEMNGKVSGIELEKRLRSQMDVVNCKVSTRDLDKRVDELVNMIRTRPAGINPSDPMSVGLKSNPTIGDPSESTAQGNHTIPLFIASVRFDSGTCQSYKVAAVSEGVAIQKIKLMFPRAEVIGVLHKGMVIL